MSNVYCRYATAPAEMWRDSNRGWVKVEEPERDMCSWATFHPESAEKLSNTPPWLQRNAIAGHLMRKGDCEKCPLFERGDPVE